MPGKEQNENDTKTKVDGVVLRRHLQEKQLQILVSVSMEHAEY